MVITTVKSSLASCTLVSLVRLRQRMGSPRVFRLVVSTHWLHRFLGYPSQKRSKQKESSVPVVSIYFNTADQIGWCDVLMFYQGLDKLTQYLGSQQPSYKMRGVSAHTENWFQFAGTPWLSPGPFAFHHCQEERGAPTPADGNRRAARSESRFGNPTLVKDQPISGQICAGFLVGFSDISWFPSRIPTTPLIQK